MTKNNHPYSDIYKGYFDVRNPYTKDLEVVYQRPVPIPIYTADQLFNNQTLENIDEHIFRYFHFVAARTYQLEQIKAMYVVYWHVKQDWERQKEIYTDLSEGVNADETALQKFKAELDYLVSNERYQSDLSGNIKDTLRNYEKDLPAALATFNSIIQGAHLKHKKALLDFQSNLEEERKMAILTAY